MNTIKRFKEARPSIVYISALADQVNLNTGDVTRVPTGTGTGWVWDDKGHVVTNYHVVQLEQNGLVSDVAEVRVTLVGGKPTRRGSLERAWPTTPPCFRSSRHWRT